VGRADARDNPVHSSHSRPYVAISRQVLSCDAPFGGGCARSRAAAGEAKPATWAQLLRSRRRTRAPRQNAASTPDLRVHEFGHAAR
jgi:hypothetical protein